MLRLIEDEVSQDNYVKTGSMFVEKNALNDEFTHSYYARVLDAGENNRELKSGDIVYLRRVYAREMYYDEENVPYMVCSVGNIIAKIRNFDISKIFTKE